jgi:glycine/D-amino acid oxidase-like deaminating enzyme
MPSILSSSFKPTPYWHADIAVPQLSQATLPPQVDVAIIGAGFTGLATALHLLQAGKSVVVLDAMSLGDGASGKNGGMVGPSLHKLGLAGLTKQYGERQGYAILQEGIHAIKYLPSFIEQYKLDCDLHMSGRFTGVKSQQQFDTLARNCADFDKLDGFKYELVMPHQVANEIGSEHYYAGAIYGLDGGLHPFKLLCALAQKVIQLGGAIFENTAVTDFQPHGSGQLGRPSQRLTTSKGYINAADLVVATNGYSKAFNNPALGYFSKRVMPLTSAMIATEILPAATIKQLFPHGRMHGGIHRLVQYYRPSPDGRRVLFGARGVDLWDRADKNAHNLHFLLSKIFPQLEQVKIDYCWSGKVAYTFDHSPHIGLSEPINSSPEGVYYAMGYCGSGVTRSIYLANKLAQQILGAADFNTVFHQLPFQTKPFYTGKPWFMPIVLKWHSFLDGIEQNNNAKR